MSKKILSEEEKKKRRDAYAIRKNNPIWVAYENARKLELKRKNRADPDKRRRELDIDNASRRKKRAEDEEWREKDRVYCRATQKAMRENNPDWVESERKRKREDMRKRWHSDPTVKEKMYAWRNAEYKKNPSFKLSKTLRDRIYAAMKHGIKSGSTLELLGCSFEELRVHLESQFEEGMSWENHGSHGWHIDHIVPLSKFDLIDPIAQRVACNYKNLQPLWAFDNLSKGAKLPESMVI